MPNKIQFKRGLKASLPDLDAGEPGYCTDSQEFYIGNSTGANKKVVMSGELIFSVKDFEAKGDGVTDATAGINATVAAASATGGVVFFPPGTYLVSASLPVTTQSISFIGSGIGVSIIKRTDTFNGQLIQASGNNFQCRDITIDGNVSGNTINQHIELLLSGNDAVVSNISVINSRAIGIGITGSNNKILFSTIIGSNSALIPNMGMWFDEVTIPDGLLVMGCKFLNNGINAILGKGYNIKLIGNYFKNNHLQTTPTGGGQIQILRFATGSWEVIGNTFTDGGGPVTCGVELDGTNVVFEGNHVMRNQLGGVVLQSSGLASHVIISNNIIYDNGNGTAGSGISVDVGISNVTIKGNHSYDTRTIGSKTQIYGIEVAAGSSDNIIITDNNLVGNKTGDILYSGTGANRQVYGNLPFSTQFISQEPIQFSLAPGASQILMSGIDAFGVIDVKILNSSSYGRFTLNGAGHTVTKITDTSTAFDTTDTGVLSNVIHNGTNYVLKNRSAGTLYYSYRITLT